MTHSVTWRTYREGKKLCKKNKVEPASYILKHYKDGDFHKDYDRRETIQSMSTFLRDPSGDIPWDEDEQGVDVVHINDVNVSVFGLAWRRRRGEWMVS